MLNHRQALIIFWSCASLMVTGFTITLTNFHHGLLIQANHGLVFFTFIASMMFLPVMLLIPLIGGGRFKTKLQPLRGNGGNE